MYIHRKKIEHAPKCQMTTLFIDISMFATHKTYVGISPINVTTKYAV